MYEHRYVSELHAANEPASYMRQTLVPLGTLAHQRKVLDKKLISQCDCEPIVSADGEACHRKAPKDGACCLTSLVFVDIAPHMFTNLGFSVRRL